MIFDVKYTVELEHDDLARLINLVEMELDMAMESLYRHSESKEWTARVEDYKRILAALEAAEGM